MSLCSVDCGLQLPVIVLQQCGSEESLDSIRSNRTIIYKIRFCSSIIPALVGLDEGCLLVGAPTLAVSLSGALFLTISLLCSV